jgi:hypothetical protein
LSVLAAALLWNDRMCNSFAPPVLCSYLPYIGQVTIVMNDYPMFKYALIAVLGVFVLTSKE